MSIYFDFKSINELTGYNYHRQPDDGLVDLLTNPPFIGLIDEDEMNLKSIFPANRQIQQDTTKFTPDDWIRYITPLVTYALREPTQGMNAQRSYQKFILLGVLVGLGKTPQEAINQLEVWQNTGASQILKGGTSTGTGMGSSGGTTGGTGIGASGGTGMGASGGTTSGTGIGAIGGTTGGTGIGASGGTGTGTSGGTTGGTGMGSSGGTTSGTGMGSSGGAGIGSGIGTRDNTNKSDRLYFD